MSAQSTPGGNIYFTTPEELTTPDRDRQRAINRDARDREVRTVYDELTARMGNIETMAGVAPGDVTDAQTATLVQGPDSVTRTRLNNDFVQAASINRIVASEDPNTVLQPGDLLIVLRTQWFTDFSEYPVGQPPHDWSDRWHANSAWSIVEHPDTPGQKLLQQTFTSNFARAFVWDAVREAEDAEVVMKWRATGASLASARPAKLIARGRGTPAAPTGYHGGVQNNTRRSIQMHLADTNSTDLSSAETSTSSNRWYITRFRVEGNLQQARTWPADQPEPTAWETESTNADITGPGWVGIRTFSTNDVREIAFFGVGTNGNPAPMGASI